MSTALWGSSGEHYQGRLDRTMLESLRIEIPREGCTSLPRVKLMGCTQACLWLRNEWGHLVAKLTSSPVAIEIRTGTPSGQVNQLSSLHIQNIIYTGELADLATRVKMEVS